MKKGIIMIVIKIDVIHANTINNDSDIVICERDKLKEVKVIKQINNKVDQAVAILKLRSILI